MRSNARIDDIEVLRAFAIIFVIMHHFNGGFSRFETGSFVNQFYSYFNGGVGVDLFFGISGFVIARSLLPNLWACTDARGRRQTIYSFWIRRMSRLFPAAWLWLGLILVFQVFFNDSNVFGGLKENLWSTVAGVFQFANVRLGDAFINRSGYGASFVYWSLSLEEQFYFAFPLLALLPKRWLVAALAVIIAYQLLSPRAIWEMMFRTDALCSGVLLAIMHESKACQRFLSFLRIRPLILTGLFPLLLCILVVSASDSYKITFNQYSGDYYSFYYYSVVTVITFLIVLIASLNIDLAKRILPLHSLFMWIGSRSYGLYLIHVPLNFLIRELCFNLGISVSNYVIPLTLLNITLLGVIAQLNFKWIEQPFRQRGAAFAREKFGN
jgi:peptidoglycan/LPS O-acetylase OafA/YrhL